MLGQYVGRLTCEEEEKVVVSISVTFRILVMDCVNTI